MPIGKSKGLAESPGYYHYRMKSPQIFMKDEYIWKVRQKPVYGAGKKLVQKPVDAIYGSPYGSKPSDYVDPKTGKMKKGHKKYLQAFRFPKKYWKTEKSVMDWVRKHASRADWTLEPEQKRAIKREFGPKAGARLVRENPELRFRKEDWPRRSGVTRWMHKRAKDYPGMAIVGSRGKEYKVKYGKNPRRTKKDMIIVDGERRFTRAGAKREMADIVAEDKARGLKGKLSADGLYYYRPSQKKLGGFAFRVSAYKAYPRNKYSYIVT